MQTSFSQGDAVRVYDTPDNRARAEHTGADVRSRPAVVEREMPYDAGRFQVAFADGAEPTSAIVSDEYLLPAGSAASAGAGE